MGDHVNDTIAGGIGSLFKIGAGHPLETIKVRMQTKDLHNSSGMIQEFNKIRRNEGLGGLYRGALPNLPAMFIYNSSLFFGQGLALDWMEHPSSMYSIAAAGGVGGVFASLLTNPLELVKIKLQVQTNRPTIRGQLETIKQICRETGPKGMYKGVQLMLLREIPANMIYFVGFEASLRAQGYSCDPQKTHKQAPLGSIFIAGGIAGIGNWILIFPVDTLKTRFQANSLPSGSWRSFCLSELQKPWKYLYKGYLTCLLRAFIANAATFVGVEYSRRVLTSLSPWNR